MQERHWISNQKLWWESNEWDEAFTECTNSNVQFNQLDGTEKVNCMIDWLMDTYPVSREQIDQRKMKMGIGNSKSGTQ